MADDREQELERLERELLADEVIGDDDLLSDLPIQLLDTRPLSWSEDEGLTAEEEIIAEEELPVEDIINEIIAEEANLSVEDIINETLREAELSLESEDYEDESMKDSKKKAPKNSKDAQKREDRWLIVLMAIASFLCVGIIGILVYWSEVFLK